MGLDISRDNLRSIINQQADHRRHGGVSEVDLGNGMTVTIHTKSIGERFKAFFSWGENRAYETVTIKDTQGRIAGTTEFKLSAFGMKRRTKELEDKLGDVLSKINASQKEQESKNIERSSMPKVPDNIDKLSKEELKLLDSAIFKNIPENISDLSTDKLQQLIEETSVEAMGCYAEVYAAGFKVRDPKDNSEIEKKLDVIVQAIGHKLLNSVENISNQDVEKLQIIIDKSRSYNLDSNQLWKAHDNIEDRLDALQTLQNIRDGISNSVIDNTLKLIKIYNNFSFNDFFLKAIRKKIAETSTNHRQEIEEFKMNATDNDRKMLRLLRIIAKGYYTTGLNNK